MDPTWEYIGNSTPKNNIKTPESINDEFDKIDLKDALFKPQNPVQVFDIKEKFAESANGTKPWYKDPLELIDFKKIFEPKENRTYNEETNHYTRIALFTVIGTLLLFELFNLNIILLLAIIALIVSIFFRPDKATEGFSTPYSIKPIVNDGKIEYEPCETPHDGFVDELSPERLRKERPQYYRSFNENSWDQVNRPIKKVCPTTDEHGEAIKYIYGTVKRRLYF